MVLHCLAGNQCRVVVLLRRIQMALVAPEYGDVPPTSRGPLLERPGRGPGLAWALPPTTAKRQGRPRLPGEVLYRAVCGSTGPDQ
ncbi:unnamed protein product [Sphagnum balticum]